MNIFKFFTIILCFFSIHISLKAQNEGNQERESFKDRFVFGGSIGAQFGSYTSVIISPFAGYYFMPRLMGGTSLTYQYYYEKELRTSVSTHIYGGSVMGEYAIIDNIGKNLPVKADFSIIGHLEYEALNMDRDFSDIRNKVDRFWLHGILVGGGIKQNFGKHSSLNITILYNLLWDERLPYTNPVIRIGIYL